MQKLHLVGFTPNLDGLILSTRKGAKSGSFVVSIDADVLEQLTETAGAPVPAPSSTRMNGSRPHRGPRTSRPDSQLGPREMQELLRGGWSLEEVAVEAGVDVDWVSRFAAPVLAEMRLVLDQARSCTFEKPRVGPSALALAPSVRRNVAERGVRFTDEDFEDCWRAHQLDDVLWVVGFDYQSRGKRQTAEWTIDLETGELMSRGRLGTQLGHVQSARRRVNLTPPPKPKPKAASARAVRAPAPLPTVPAKKTATKAAKATKTANRPRAASATKKTKKKATPPPKSAKRPHPVDPWREELRRRELERSAALAAAPPPPPPPAPDPPRRAPAPPPPPEPEPEPELRPVAIIGPTVRALARRPPPPTPPPRREQDTGPVPEVREEWPDLRWAPGGGNVGPLPPPEPLPVPEQVRERVSAPLGQFDDEPEDDGLGADTWFPPARPVFTGAQAAGSGPPRRRRSEPLRGR